MVLGSGTSTPASDVGCVKEMLLQSCGRGIVEETRFMDNVASGIW
jgi:hypothetical protein